MMAVLFLKNLLFTLVVPGTVAVALPLLIARGQQISSGLVLLAALALFALGATIYTWCVWDFATIGRGTPAPVDPPKKLVVHGLYRYTRNPMYVGVLTVLIAWVVLFQAWPLLLYALAVGTFFHLFIVLYEEPHLQKLFGSEYTDYRARVGRWFILK